MTTAADMRKACPPNPERIATCSHESLYWYSSPHDERGWLCVDCGWAPGEEPGYSPEHDRDRLWMKCWCLLHDMADAGLVSVSNSSGGDALASAAERIARDARTLDQESIVAILAKLCAGDGAFWRERHESILAGRDNRNRCHCGKLAHIWQSGPNGGTHYCSYEHSPDVMAGLVDSKEPF